MFQYYRVSKNINDKRKGAGITILRRNFFCLTVPKNLVEDPFRALFQEVSGNESLWIRAGEKCQSVPSNTFCLTVPKLFVGEPFSVSIISRIEKAYAEESYVPICCRSFFLSRYRKNSKVNPSVFHKFSGNEKIYG